MLGFKYKNETYYYQKNIQEDIVGIYNNNYELIATYEYDSWGQVLSVKDNQNEEIPDSSHIAIKNPFRYRSYYYDKETQLYYLNSRYYNPEWGRFINADGLIGTTDSNAVYNLYCYVNNSPIMNDDIMGAFSWFKKVVSQIAKSVVKTISYVGGLICKAPVAGKAFSNSLDAFPKKLSIKDKEIVAT